MNRRPSPTAQDSESGSRRCRRWKRWLRLGLLLAGTGTVLAYAGFCIVWWVCPFPIELLERQPVSPLVTDRSGQVLLSLVGDNDQWRQPVPLEQISPWLVQATLAAEDARFRQHRGVDYSALLRAVCQNVMHGQVVSGASTLTMQVCRQLDRRPRTVSSKFWQMLRAWQLEQLRSKDQILAAYLNLAPYGGNVLGAEAAAQRFFNKHAIDLTLGEAALLAGLPQSPNRFRPDRYPEAARKRRQFVLRRMKELGMISAQQGTNADAEPLPMLTVQRPPVAPHAAWLALQRRPRGGRTTIDLPRQQSVEAAIGQQVTQWPVGTDVAVCVLEIASGDILAWVGSADPKDPRDGQVNGGLALRSPGSALKPFLYAAAFQSRRMNPQSLVHDGPLERAGWSPENFDKTFSGDITAAEALRRSLNVPAILVAEQVGLTRCVGTISAAGISLPANAAQRGGLALAVGGIEVSLLDLTAGYATLGRQGIAHRPRLFLDESASHTKSPGDAGRETSALQQEVSVLGGRGSCQAVLDATYASCRDKELNQSPLAPVLRGEGAGVRGKRASRSPLTPSPSLPSTGARGAKSLGKIASSLEAAQSPRSLDASGSAGASPSQMTRVLDADVCAAINDILSVRHRRPKGWEQFGDSQLPWCMWKTGTSSGHRDAWAVGHNGRYAIGVWVGHFSGTGHVDYVGQEAAEPLLATLFASPEFRVDQHPQPAATWTVTRPFQLTQPPTAPLSITTPVNGDIFLSTTGTVTIKPATNRESTARWFLNGRLLADHLPDQLDLQPGRYELRCVDHAGHSSAVRFAVETFGR